MASITAHQICISKERNMNYKGVFFDGNPLDYISPLFMFRLLMSVLISQMLWLILRPLKQPKIVCSILAGIIMGPSVLGRSKSYMATMFPLKEKIVLETMTNLGTIFFIFLVSIKIDVAHVVRTANKTWKICFACIIYPFLFTISLVTLLCNVLPGLMSQEFSFKFSLSSSLSFFIVIVNALDELKLLSSELGQLASSIALLNEVYHFFFVMILSVLSHRKRQYIHYVALSLLGFLAITLLVITPIVQWIIKRTPKGQAVKEGYVIAIILLTLSAGVITDALGFSFIHAAMIMGMIIPAGSPLASSIIQKCELLIYEFFLPLFFIRIGYFTDLSRIHDWSKFAAFGAVILVGYLGRLVGCCKVSSSLNINTRSAILLSLILSLQGVIELHQAMRWKSFNLISDQNYSTFVLSIVVMNAIITPLIEILYNGDPMNSRMSSTKHHSFRSLGMTSQLGELRIISCVQDEGNVPTIINLLEALNPREMTSINAYIIHLVSLATQSVPLLVPYKNHRIKSCLGHRKPNDSDNIVRAFINYANNSKGMIQINPFKMISPFKYMHEPICRLAEEIGSPLIIVPFFKTQEATTLKLSIDGTLRIFNTSIQASARCTVGILVDRGLRTMITTSDNFSYNVAVIFLGGADGREALALEARMSRHSKISITVLRINMIDGDGAKGFENERELDDNFFTEFKAMNIVNTRVVCHELVVENIVEAISAIRSLPNDGYDIVVVGKRQGCNSQFETDLPSWAEYPELGVLGDAMAAPDFCKGSMMSVLVLQHGHDKENLSRISRRSSLLDS